MGRAGARWSVGRLGRPNGGGACQRGLSPILFGLALDRRRGWVLALEPVGRPAGSIGRVLPLRDDAFKAEIAGVREHSRPVTGLLGPVYPGSLAAGSRLRKQVAANAVLSRATPFDHPPKALFRRSRRRFARTDDTVRLLRCTQHWPGRVRLSGVWPGPSRASPRAFVARRRRVAGG